MVLRWPTGSLRNSDIVDARSSELRASRKIGHCRSSDAAASAASSSEESLGLPGVEAPVLLCRRLSPQLRVILTVMVPAAVLVVEEKSIPEPVMGIPMVEPRAGLLLTHTARPADCASSAADPGGQALIREVMDASVGTCFHGRGNVGSAVLHGSGEGEGPGCHAAAPRGVGGGGDRLQLGWRNAHVPRQAVSGEGRRTVGGLGRYLPGDRVRLGL